MTRLGTAVSTTSLCRMTSFGTLVDWLGRYSAAVVALATLALAVMTGVYVVLTRRLVQEQREHSRRIVAPLLSFELQVLEDGVLGLVTRNVGVAARWLALGYKPRPPVGWLRLDQMDRWVDLAPGEWRRWTVLGDRSDDSRLIVPLVARYVDAA